MTNVISIDQKNWDMLIHMRSRIKFYQKKKPDIANRFKELYSEKIGGLRLVA